MNQSLQLIEQARQAAERVNAIKNNYIRDRRIDAEARALGIDPNEFRRLLRAPTSPKTGRAKD